MRTQIRSCVLATLIGLVACRDQTPNPPSLNSTVLSSRIGDRFHKLLQGLVSRDASSREAAFDSIQKTWSRHRKRAASLSHHPEARKRLAGAYLLSRLGEAQDLPALRRFLSDINRRVRVTAMAGVRRLKDKQSTSILLTRLNKANYDEQRIIVGTLIDLDVEFAETVIVRLSRADDWALRRVAAQSIAQLDSAKSAQLLEELIEDRVWMVRSDAVVAIGRREHRGAIDRIRKRTRDETWSVRATAARVLARFAEAEDFKLIADLALRDPQPEVRRAALSSLSGYQNRAAPVLVQALRKESEPGSIRSAALRALAEIDSTDHRAHLQWALETGDADLRKLAARILSSSGSSKTDAAAQPPK